MPASFYRLSARAQRCYLKSDAVERFDFAPTPTPLALTASLVNALQADTTGAVESAARKLLTKLCCIAGVKPLRVDVMGVPGAGLVRFAGRRGSLKRRICSSQAGG